ncbi:ATP-dependent Clp protease proteolytic subunit [Pseudonocardia lacus]|uniref:ATP-dependent Clp protease proteolytic subunit n=1 Tax=Pseudonocardia lacus TaxID=2835865 RepID=UPI0020298BE1|nr:ATP-dependent Clp protease proteolytic subunit [Pseudonocardia lacus]
MPTQFRPMASVHPLAAQPWQGHEPQIPAPAPRHPPRPEPQPLAPAVGPVLHAPAPPAVPDPVVDRLLAERIVFLGQEVDDAIANRICAQLLLLSAEDPERDIALYINSPGGSVTAGMAIYDTMRLVKPDVATWSIGFTASMGQFLLSAGTPGKRHALPHARILMHQPSAGMGGNASDIAIRAGVYGAMKREIAELIAEHTGQSFETITADSDRDRWFTATEARDYGLVDHVVTP